MKSYCLYILVFCLLSTNTSAQQHKFNLTIGGGSSLNGTGDLKGYIFINQVDINLNKHFFLSPGISFSSHSGINTLSNSFSVNAVISGINLFANINFKILDKSKHKISLGAGPMLRFQHSSNPTDMQINLSPNNEYIYTLKYDKLRTTSVGYNISPAYAYQFCKKMFAGAKFILQNDTEADVFTSSIFFIGVNL